MKQFLAYIFIVAIILGQLFTPLMPVHAQVWETSVLSPDSPGVCFVVFYKNGFLGGRRTSLSGSSCESSSDAATKYRWLPTSFNKEFIDGNWNPTDTDPSIVNPQPGNTPITGKCVVLGSDGAPDPTQTKTGVTKEDCDTLKGSFSADTNGTISADTNGITTDSTKPSDQNESLFGSCNLTAWTISGCIVSGFYWVFLVLPSYVLYLTAYMFNAMLALTLGSTLYKNNFLPEAWRIIRDFSNIFFILVLLYIAIRMILGLAGAEGKKMIGYVVVAALLINFSMFFTQVVIDSSNILALIFYNKIQVTPCKNDPSYLKPDDKKTGSTTVATGDSCNNNYTPSTVQDGIQEKDIAGGIVAGFNPAKFINPGDVVALNKTAKNSPGFFESIKNSEKGVPILLQGQAGALGAIGYLINSGGDGKTLPPSIALAVIFTACAVYLFAAWAFFVAGIAFIGRLVELWVLIIFSPFAFMSLSVPQLEKIDYLGWSSWTEHLLKTAFMAPIFMFLILLISKLVQINVFAGIENKNPNVEITIPHVLVMLVIPAIIYLTMLHKATEYAKKGGGEVGAAIMKYGKMAAVAVGGVALGAASGGASLALTNTVGRTAANIGQSERFRTWAANKGALGRFTSKGLGKVADSSFDARNTKAIGSLAKQTGINLDRGKAIGLGKDKGGFSKRRDARAKELEEFANKNLDTTAKGKAEFTRGGMNEDRAEAIKAQLKIAGMTETAAEGHKQSLKGNGINMRDLAGVVDHLNAAKREKYADNLDKRSFGTILGDFWGTADSKLASRRMAGNAVRKDAAGLKASRQLAESISALAKAQTQQGNAAHAPTAPTPPSPAGPAPHP